MGGWAQTGDTSNLPTPFVSYLSALFNRSITKRFQIRPKCLALSNFPNWELHERQLIYFQNSIVAQEFFCLLFLGGDSESGKSYPFWV